MPRRRTVVVLQQLHEIPGASVVDEKVTGRVNVLRGLTSSDEFWEEKEERKEISTPAVAATKTTLGSRAPQKSQIYVIYRLDLKRVFVVDDRGTFLEVVSRVPTYLENP